MITNSQTSSSDQLDEDLSSEEMQMLQQVMLLSKSGILLRKDTISIRAFLLEDNTTVCAYLLSETEDSFVILMPSLVGAAGSDVACDPITRVPMVRLLKNQVKMVTMPPNKFLYYYLLGTKDRRAEVPGYFTPGRTQQADSVIEVIYNVEKGLPSSEEVKVSPKSEIVAARRSRVSEEEEGERFDPSIPPSRPTKKYRH